MRSFGVILTKDGKCRHVSSADFHFENTSLRRFNPSQQRTWLVETTWKHGLLLLRHDRAEKDMAGIAQLGNVHRLSIGVAFQPITNT